MSEDSKILSEKDFKYELHWACVSASQASFKYSKKVQDSHDALRARITDLEAENHALRCCGNCKHSDTVGARKECVGCYGFSDVDFEETKTYPAKWVNK